MFHKATKSQSKLRMALMGPSGSGKTYTALSIATGLGKRIALIDTEHQSASKYANLFEFDECMMEDHNPERYIEAIGSAEDAGYDVLIIDSLSHAWAGKNGILQLNHEYTKNSNSKNSFFAWQESTPLHNALVEAMLAAKLHIIGTLRTKTEYVVENENGRHVPRKVGTAPVQRDGYEYEFDIVADLNQQHTFTVNKTRCDSFDGFVTNKPGPEVGAALLDWLGDGEPVAYATDQQKMEILACVESSGMTAVKFKERLEAFGALSLDDLTLKNAMIILDRIKVSGKGK